MQTKTDIYLQNVSQCLYNIGQMIEAHLIEPIELDKRLDRFYQVEVSKLSKLLETPMITLDISDLNTSLAKDIFFTNTKTERSREQIEQARDYISMSLSEVQGKRNYSDSVPTTGIEVGELKKFLESFLLKKQTNNKPKKSPICEVRDNRIFIDNRDSGVELTPKIVSLLKRLLKIDDFYQYKIIKSTDLRGNIKKDAFRTQLSRLRKETSKLFEIRRFQTNDNKPGYKLVFEQEI